MVFDVTTFSNVVGELAVHLGLHYHGHVPIEPSTLPSTLSNPQTRW